MTNKADLVEQHIRLYDSRLNHINEMMKKAHETVAESPEHRDLHPELSGLSQEHQKLEVRVDEFKLKSNNWELEEIERDGPMGALDALAQEIEKFVEKLGK
jgi:hypothetical protein